MIIWCSYHGVHNDFFTRLISLSDPEDENISVIADNLVHCATQLSVITGIKDAKTIEKLLQSALFYGRKKVDFSDILEGRLGKEYSQGWSNMLNDKAYVGLITTCMKVDPASEQSKEHHAIQWLLVVEENKKNPFLKHPPSDVYARMGSELAIGKNSLYDWDEFKDNDAHMVWDLLFDRVGGLDFRSPLVVTMDVSDHKKWPLLGECLQREKEAYYNKKKMMAKRERSCTNLIREGLPALLSWDNP